MDDVLEAWRSNNRINLLLFDQISDEGMRCTLSKRGGPANDLGHLGLGSPVSGCRVPKKGTLVPIHRGWALAFGGEPRAWDRSGDWRVRSSRIGNPQFRESCYPWISLVPQRLYPPLRF